DAATVFLENLADDREPQSGAFLARRHIGFHQAIAIFLRQPNAVIDDVDDDRLTLACRRYLDAPAPEFRRRNGGHRLGVVLDDVGQRLRDQAAIEPRRHRILGYVDLNVDVGVADP